MRTALVLFGPVGPEVLIVLALLLLLFGANRIPKLARSMGEATGTFKKGREEIEEELEESKQELSEAKSDALGTEEETSKN